MIVPLRVFKLKMSGDRDTKDVEDMSCGGRYRPDCKSIQCILNMHVLQEELQATC
jgi:hypothetical protein